MTAQVPEVLNHDGRELQLLCEPLEPWLKKAGIKMSSMVTCCWRGYVGTWAIRDSKLFLDRIESFHDWSDRVEAESGANTPALESVAAYVDMGPPARARSISRLFPDAKGPVHATWYTGRLRCGEGEMLSYFHGGFGSRRERERLMWVQDGRFVKERVRDYVALGEFPDPVPVPEPQSGVPPGSIEAYRETDYVARVRGAELVIRIGEHCPELDRLIARHRPNRLVSVWRRKVDQVRGRMTRRWSQGAAFITAWNPYGEACCAEENAAANRELRARLIEHGAVVYEGEGRPRQEGWDPEGSFLAVGVSERDACYLARRAEQNAIVHAVAGEAARLLLLR